MDETKPNFVIKRSPARPDRFTAYYATTGWVIRDYLGRLGYFHTEDEARTWAVKTLKDLARGRQPRRPRLQSLRRRKKRG